MKIGILTYHRAENYGALLQAYALSTFLRKLGHKVSFIDYWPEYHVEHYRVFSKKRFQRLSFLGKVRYILMAPLWSPPRLLRKWRLEKFMHEQLLVGKHISYQRDDQKTNRYDLAIYGSDQIWRKQDIHNNEFNQWYFGTENVVADRKITYAASMGVIKTTEEENCMIKGFLKHFDALSVREKDLHGYLANLGLSSTFVIDPVFLLEKEEWRSLFKPYKGKKYILFYNLLGTQESVMFAEALSRETGLPIKEITVKFRLSKALSDRYYACSSIEHFLQMIDGAEYVVSSSFHGVAFSLIFEKQFWATGMRERSSRVISLMSCAGISERYINTEFSRKLMETTINYSSVNERLNDFKALSKKFLTHTLV